VPRNRSGTNRSRQAEPRPGASNHPGARTSPTPSSHSPAPSDTPSAPSDSTSSGGNCSSSHRPPPATPTFPERSTLPENPTAPDHPALRDPPELSDTPTLPANRTLSVRWSLPDEPSFPGRARSPERSLSSDRPPPDNPTSPDRSEFAENSPLPDRPVLRVPSGLSDVPARQDNPGLPGCGARPGRPTLGRCPAPNDRGAPRRPAASPPPVPPASRTPAPAVLLAPTLAVSALSRCRIRSRSSCRDMAPTVVPFEAAKPSPSRRFSRPVDNCGLVENAVADLGPSSSRGCGGVGENAGGFYDHIDTQIAPRQVGRVAFGQDQDGRVPDRIAPGSALTSPGKRPISSSARSPKVDSARSRPGTQSYATGGRAKSVGVPLRMGWSGRCPGRLNRRGIPCTPSSVAVSLNSGCVGGGSSSIGTWHLPPFWSSSGLAAQWVTVA
jgi:hypothetical protein